MLKAIFEDGCWQDLWLFTVRSAGVCLVAGTDKDGPAVMLSRDNMPDMMVPRHQSAYLWTLSVGLAMVPYVDYGSWMPAKEGKDLVSPKGRHWEYMRTSDGIWVTEPQWEKWSGVVAAMIGEARDKGMTDLDEPSFN